MSMLDEPVAPVLRQLSVLMGVGVVFMMLMNVIDTYWASQLSTEALAAMSFAFPVIGVALNVSLGLMIGVSVAVARALGEQDEPRSRVLSGSRRTPTVTRPPTSCCSRSRCTGCPRAETARTRCSPTSTSPRRCRRPSIGRRPGGPGARREQKRPRRSSAAVFLSGGARRLTCRPCCSSCGRP